MIIQCENSGVDKLSCDCYSNLWKQMYLSKNQVSSMMKSKKEIHFDANETIVKQGSDINHIHIIKHGVIAQYFEENKNKIIFRIIKGIDFAMLPFLNSDSIYPCSIKAIVPTTICQIKNSVFYDILSGNREANDFLIKWHHQYIYEMYGLLKNRIISNNPGKLAYALKLLDSQQWNGKSLLSVVDKNFISQMLGVSIDSTNKILSEFKKNKIISLNGKCIKLINSSKLNNLCQYG